MLCYDIGTCSTLRTAILHRFRLWTKTRIICIQNGHRSATFDPMSNLKVPIFMLFYVIGSTLHTAIFHHFNAMGNNMHILNLKWPPTSHFLSKVNVQSTKYIAYSYPAPFSSYVYKVVF